jgi:hypothetical protein
MSLWQVIEVLRSRPGIMGPTGPSSIRRAGQRSLFSVIACLVNIVLKI